MRFARHFPFFIWYGMLALLYLPYAIFREQDASAVFGLEAP